VRSSRAIHGTAELAPFNVLKGPSTTSRMARFQPTMGGKRDEEAPFLEQGAAEFGGRCTILHNFATLLY
tara:strand:+ start:579 stop:785 length:207 start_codon:yes stop_codon:yes gene_type:complete